MTRMLLNNRPHGGIGNALKSKIQEVKSLTRCYRQATSIVAWLGKHFCSHSFFYTRYSLVRSILVHFSAKSLVKSSRNLICACDMRPFGPQSYYGDKRLNPSVPRPIHHPNPHAGLDEQSRYSARSRLYIPLPSHHSNSSIFLSQLSNLATHANAFTNPSAHPCTSIFPT